MAHAQRDVDAAAPPRAVSPHGEDRYRALFDAIDEGFCVVEILFGEDGRAVDYCFLEANPAFERHTGLRGAVGRTARELVPDLETHWFEAYGRVAATGEPARFVAEARPMGGRAFDAYAFRLGGDGSCQVGILFTDVTERRRAEEDRARLAAVVESSRDAIIACTPDGTIVAWNPGAEELFGFAAAEVVGRDLSMLVPPERAHELSGSLSRVVAGDRLPPLETVRVRTDGSPIQVEVRLSPIRAAGGEVVGVSAIARDITERRRTEEALRRAAARDA